MLVPHEAAEEDEAVVGHKAASDVLSLNSGRASTALVLCISRAMCRPKSEMSDGASDSSTAEMLLGEKKGPPDRALDEHREGVTVEHTVEEQPEELPEAVHFLGCSLDR